LCCSESLNAIPEVGLYRPRTGADENLFLLFFNRLQEIFAAGTVVGTALAF
jgi:hypothetical protein